MKDYYKWKIPVSNVLCPSGVSLPSKAWFTCTWVSLDFCKLDFLHFMICKLTNCFYWQTLCFRVTWKLYLWSKILTSPFTQAPHCLMLQPSSDEHTCANQLKKLWCGLSFWAGKNLRGMTDLQERLNWLAFPHQVSVVTFKHWNYTEEDEGPCALGAKAGNYHNKIAWRNYATHISMSQKHSGKKSYPKVISKIIFGLNKMIVLPVVG